MSDAGGGPDLISGFTTAIQSLVSGFQSAAQMAQASLGNIETATAATAVRLDALADGLKESGQAARNAKPKVDGVTKAVGDLAQKWLSLDGLKKMMDLSDTYANNTAALLRVTGSAQGAAQAQEAIYQAALRSRGSLQETTGMVVGLGRAAEDAFSGLDETVAFTEQLNKHFALSGTAAEGQQEVRLSVTQAMTSGTVEGEMIGDLLVKVPTLAKAVSGQLGVGTKELEKMAGQGQVTAEVWKQAMLGAAAETNAEFSQLPMTWGEGFTQAGTLALQAIQPVLAGLSWMVNHLDILGPLVLGLGGAFAVFQVAAHWTEIAAAATAAYHFAQSLLSIGLGALTGNTAAASAATSQFNSALLASPVTWIVMVVMLLVGVLYAAVAAFNRLTGESVSATGILAGAVAAAGAAVVNLLMGLAEIGGAVIGFFYNGFADFANFLYNVFHDPVGAVIGLFAGLGDNVLGVIESIFKAIDMVTGLHWTDTVVSFRENVRTIAEGAIKTYGNGTYQNDVQKFDLDATLAEAGFSLERISYGDAYHAGYDWGSALSLAGAAELSGLPGPGGLDALSEMEEHLGTIAGDTGRIAQNTADMADEDLKYLEDVAIRRYETHINSTSLTPQVSVRVDGRADRETGEDIASRIAAVLRRETAAHTSISVAEV